MAVCAFQGSAIVLGVVFKQNFAEHADYREILMKSVRMDELFAVL